MRYKYVERMEEIFFADTKAALDKLLKGEGSLSAPEVYERVFVAMQLRNTYYGENYHSTAEFLLANGYPEEAVDRFRALRNGGKNET